MARGNGTMGNCKLRFTRASNGQTILAMEKYGSVRDKKLKIFLPLLSFSYRSSTKGQAYYIEYITKHVLRRAISIQGLRKTLSLRDLPFTP